MIGVEEPGPRLFGWCDQASRVDAFAAALAALIDPGGVCSVTIESRGSRESISRRDISVEEAVAMVRAAFTTATYANASFHGPLDSGAWRGGALHCHGDGHEPGYPSGPLELSLGERKDVFPRSLTIAFGPGERVVEVEAAILAMRVQQDVENLLVRLCAPDASKRVITGTYSNASFWGAPIETCATYNSDAGAVARDLALSWIHLHTGERAAYLAGMSMEVLRARVGSAPRGASVAVALNVDRTLEHSVRERAAGPEKYVQRGRVALPGDVALSREAVLSAVAAPPRELLEALEASAVADDDWRAAEPLAREVLQATKDGAPTYEVDVTTRKHVQFIERHAPYHVRRLPNGGVLLATHPYRTLWPLYADALFLLGITS